MYVMYIVVDVNKINWLDLYLNEKILWWLLLFVGVCIVKFFLGFK